MGKKNADKPKGRTTAYAYFVQTCREEHKKKHPTEQVVFAEFSTKCAEKWKSMKDKKRFEDMAAKDKIRYDKEMANYTPTDNDKGGRGKKRKKDPNAPKRALSAFLYFCNDRRPGVKKAHPNYSIGDVAKELGKQWEAEKNRSKWEAMAKKDKDRYAKEMAGYKKSGGGSSPKKAKTAPKKKQQPVQEEEEDEEEEDEEEEDEEEEDDDEEEEDDE